MLLGAAPLPGDAAPPLALPLVCTIGKDCWVQNWPDADKGPGVADFACGARSYDGHDGTDFRIASVAAQRAGVAVLAAAPGTVLRVRDGEPDRLLAEGERPAPGRDCGNGVLVDLGSGWQAQYCHMAQGSVAVRPGQSVATGAALGKVGLSGATAFPHVHLTLRKDGAAIDPAAFGAVPGQCRSGQSLWAPASGVRYREGDVIAAGFTTAPPSVADTVDRGDALPRPDAAAPAIVAYVLAIGLAAGDVQTLVLTAPDGSEIARNTAPPLARARAQQLLFAGRRRPATGWPARLGARYRVERRGAVAIDWRFEITLSG
ncbi:peptidase M23 [alpha proteobacterium AAP81b]|nr:peptidase M23 [alpha proteobacterium AAP81b]